MTLIKYKNYSKLKEEASKLSEELYFTIHMAGEMSSMPNVIRECKKAIKLATKLEKIRRKLY